MASVESLFMDKIEFGLHKTASKFKDITGLIKNANKLLKPKNRRTIAMLIEYQAKRGEVPLNDIEPIKY